MAFVGQGDNIRAHLLEHLKEIGTLLAAHDPSGFAFELCPANASAVRTHWAANSNLVAIAAWIEGSVATPRPRPEPGDIQKNNIGMQRFSGLDNCFAAFLYTARMI